MDNYPANTGYIEPETSPERGRFALIGKIGRSVGNVALGFVENVAEHAPERLARLGGYALAGAVLSVKAMGHFAGSVLDAATTQDNDSKMAKKEVPKNEPESMKGELVGEQVEFLKKWLPEDQHQLIKELKYEQAKELAKAINKSINRETDDKRAQMLEKFLSGIELDEIALEIDGIKDPKSELDMLAETLNKLPLEQRLGIIYEALNSKQAAYDLAA